jgi:hypothetical protein
MIAQKVNPDSKEGLKMVYASQADTGQTYGNNGWNKWNWKCGVCGKVYLNRWMAQDCCTEKIALPSKEA